MNVFTLNEGHTKCILSPHRTKQRDVMFTGGRYEWSCRG